ncbi:MAG TPA: MlaD family protein [Solirubrobacteraceae bacterium]|nr:MlaD family protein [Solirubrobacteraceae bacterium]
MTRPLVVLAVVLFGLFAYWVYTTRTQSYHVKAEFQAAVNLYSGEDVKANGIDIGKVGGIAVNDGIADVTIGISNHQFYPLHRGTIADLRFGTTIGNGTREIDITPGPSSAPTIPNNGIIPVNDTESTVEFDKFFDVFNTSTRTAMQQMATNVNNSFAGHEADLGKGLAATPGGLTSIAGFMGDLSADKAALGQLVSTGDAVTTKLAANQAQIEALLGVTATTFNVFAQRTANTQASISGFAPTLTRAQSTFNRLDTSIGYLTPLMHDLAPGAKQLVPLSQQLQPALRTLRETVPDAVAAVRTGTAASPEISDFLNTGVPFMNSLAPALTKFAPMMACLRPYAPETAGFLSNWASFTEGYDSFSHYARADAPEGTSSVNSYVGITPAEYDSISGQVYALPRPPGMGNQEGNQVWFEPQCGIGPNSLNPADDPETGTNG